MRRAPIVLVATAAGLVGVLSFRSRSASLALPGISNAPLHSTAGAGLGSSSSPASSSSPSTRGGSAPISASATTPSSSTTTSTTTAPTTRSATGAVVNYNFGILSVQVSVSGSKITKVAIASLDDGGNFRSQSIDQQAIPILEQQVLQAQSASIQGVSGASYTSAGFVQSLQSALSQLGFK